MVRSPLTSLATESVYLLKAIAKTVLFGYIPVMGIIIALNYPYDTDKTPTQEKNSAAFYEAAYKKTSAQRGSDYEETAKRAAESFAVERAVRNFVHEHGLAH